VFNTVQFDDDVTTTSDISGINELLACGEQCMPSTHVGMGMEAIGNRHGAVDASSSSDKMIVKMSKPILDDGDVSSSHYFGDTIEMKTMGKVISANGDGYNFVPAYGMATQYDNEFGMVKKQTAQGIAVAFAVEDVDSDKYIPAAVEFDPDAKPPLFENRRFRLYGLVACLVFVIALAAILFSVALGTERDSKYDTNMPTQIPIPYRETLGIREKIARIISSDKLEETNDPFSKALLWITHVDPLMLLPNHPSFIQRYLLASIYYSTTDTKTWYYCNPPSIVDNETNACIYEKFINVTVDNKILVRTKIDWIRWLSNTSECDWAGITCNEKTGYVSELDLCKQSVFEGKYNVKFASNVFHYSIFAFVCALV
jgi:hypothetical protein